MTADLLADVRARHCVKDTLIPTTCALDAQPWPCDAAKLAALLTVENVADAMLNESDRQRVAGDSYPKGWLGRAERLIAELQRLTALTSEEPT